MGMNIPATSVNAALPAAKAQPANKAQAAASQTIQQGGAVSPENIEIFGQMLMGAIQDLLPQVTGGAEKKKEEPNVFDLARNFNQSGYLKFNPLGKDTLKHKTDNLSDYFTALGYDS